MAEAIDLREKCARCGHSFSFHGKAIGVTCRAMGCKGDQGQRCPGFVQQEAVSLSTPA